MRKIGDVVKVKALDDIGEVFYDGEVTISEIGKFEHGEYMAEYYGAHATKNRFSFTESEIIEDKPIQLNCTFKGDTLPHYVKDGDSAMDVHAFTFQEVLKGELLPIQQFTEDGYILRPLERVLINSGLCIEFTDEIDCSCRPRSGMSLKYGIVTQLGMVDNNYRGDIGLILINMSNDEYVIHKGERLGQIRFSKPIKVELNVIDEIGNTVRGTTGFGSSGIK